MKWSMLSTWKKQEQFRTKAEALEAMKAWKEDYEGLGWKVFGSVAKGLSSRAPDADFVADTQRAKDNKPPRGCHSARVMLTTEVRLRPEEGDS